MFNNEIKIIPIKKLFLILKCYWTKVKLESNLKTIIKSYFSRVQ